MQTSISSNRGFRKLPPRAAISVTPMILSLLMSGIVATIATLRAVGLSPDLPQHILQAWMLSYPVAFPSAIVVMPVVRRIVGLVVETPTSNR